MGVITTGNHPKALWPGLDAWFGQSYNKHPLEWKMIFEERKSSKAYEEQVEATGFGLAPVKSEGGAISYDSHTQGPTTRYTHATIALGFIVTEEEEDDNQYKDRAFDRAEMLAFSIRTTEEIIAANVLNRAFNSSYLGGDGLELCSTAHVTVNGTQSNELSAAADLSEAALEDMIIQIGQAKNSRGLQIALVPQKLIIPVNLQFEAERILESVGRSGTAENDINAIKSMGMLPGGAVVNHYLTDTDAWFVSTNAPRGLQRFTRKAVTFAQDSDFDTSNKKHKAGTRFSVGWSDWRGVYGTEGS